MRKILLSLFVFVAASVCGENHWTLDVDPLGFQNHEDVLVHLAGDNLEVAAFALNDTTWECRGVQTVYGGSVRMVMVYGDDGDEIYLRVWNNDTGVVEPKTEKFTIDMSLPILEVDMDETTGQTMAKYGNECVETVYDLMGRRVADKARDTKRIVIINGRKYTR